MELNKIIQNKRLSLNETQRQFGDRFGVSNISVCNWESGKAEAPYRVLIFCLGMSEWIRDNLNNQIKSSLKDIIGDCEDVNAFIITKDKYGKMKNLFII